MLTPGRRRHGQSGPLAGLLGRRRFPWDFPQAVRCLRSIRKGSRPRAFAKGIKGNGGECDAMQSGGSAGHRTKTFRFTAFVDVTSNCNRADVKREPQIDLIS